MKRDNVVHFREKGKEAIQDQTPAGGTRQFYVGPVYICKPTFKLQPKNKENCFQLPDLVDFNSFTRKLTSVNIM